MKHQERQIRNNADMIDEEKLENVTGGGLGIDGDAATINDEPGGDGNTQPPSDSGRRHRPIMK